MIGTIQAKVLAFDVIRLFHAHPPNPPRVHQKTLGAVLLLLGGEGRDEGGLKTFFRLLSAWPQY
jgi:hypothetical protein